MLRIGIDVGGTKLEGILMNELGEVVHSVRDSTSSEYVGIVGQIKDIVDELDKVAGHPCPIGLGTPGAWVSTQNVMKNCNSTAFNGKPLLFDLQRIFNRPIRIANDADCMAMSEAADGAGAGASSVFAVILGTGVGAGCVINGKLLQGPNGLSGEWGHNAFPRAASSNAQFKCDPDKEVRKCYCGKTNCVETFLCGRGLEETYFNLHGSHLSSKEIGKADTEESLEAIDEYVQQLALALTVVVNIIDPEVIVLAGGLSQIERIYPALPNYLKEFSFSSEGLTQVKPATYGASSGRRGAAWLFSATEGG